MTRTVLTVALAVAAASAGPRLSFVQGYSFDPLTERPALPAGLTVAGYGGSHGYYIIQFRGPVRSDWRQAAAAAGAELLEYVPQYAFVARGIYLCRLAADDYTATRKLILTD
ncbi:hypothetical protein FJY71_07100 [candidate division WOR-3 bacterium]|nr:hypothetical protein [candidate division WOR-3 bacterium]